MSLSTPEQPKQFSIAIFASKSLDNPEFIPDLLEDNLASIAHIYTNGANHLVTDFAQEKGIPHTIFPLTGGRSLPWATSRILENVDFAYIIADSNSKSSGQIVAACEHKWKKEEGQKQRWKLIHFDPYTHWKNRVMKAAEQITAMTPEDWEKNPMVGKIAEAL